MMRPTGTGRVVAEKRGYRIGVDEEVRRIVPFPHRRRLMRVHQIEMPDLLLLMLLPSTPIYRRRLHPRRLLHSNHTPSVAHRHPSTLSQQPKHQMSISFSLFFFFFGKNEKKAKSRGFHWETNLEWQYPAGKGKKLRHNRGKLCESGHRVHYIFLYASCFGFRIS